MANYYFLATLLPPLKVGSPPELSSKELHFLLKENLSQEDYKKVLVIQRLVDIENIRNFLLNTPFQSGGTYNTFELSEFLTFEEVLPTYILDFWQTYTDTESRLEHFPELLRRYFEIESKTKDPFLSSYLQFEWQWRLIFVALRAKELDRDIKYELRYEDPDDLFIAQIIAQNESNTFDPPYPFGGLKALFEARKNAPLDLYQALCEWRFEHIQDEIAWQFFSTDRILGYVAELDICEKWLELNKKKGLKFLQELIET